MHKKVILKKKILFITHRYHPSVGGAELVFKKWAETLAEKGHSLQILTTAYSSGSDNYSEINNDLSQTESINTVSIYRFSTYKFYFRIFFRIFWKPLLVISPIKYLFGSLIYGPHFLPFPEEISSKKYDLIIAGPTPSATIYYAFLFSKIKKIPFVIFPHMHITDPIHTGLLNLIILKKSNKVITLTNAETKYLIKKGVDKNKILQVFNVVNSSILSNLSNKKKYLLNDINNYVLFLGREDKYKNIFLLIEAMKIIWKKGYKQKLAIIGTRTTYFSPKLDHYINKLEGKYRKNIIRINNIDEKTKIQILDHCLFLVNPSFYESFGLVFLEAWARKKAVIGSNIDAVKCVIDNNKNGILYKTNNLNDLGAKITYLIDNPKTRMKMGKNGYIKIVKKYNETRLFNLIDKLITTIN